MGNYKGITGSTQGASPNFDDGTLCGGNLDLSGILPPGQIGNCYANDGDLWMGSTSLTPGGTHARIGRITSTDGSITVTNGSGFINLSGSAQGFQPNAVLQEFDDFLGSLSSGTKLTWDINNPICTDGTTDHPGILVLQTSASSNHIYWKNFNTVGNTVDVNPIALGGGVISISWNMKLTALSNAGNNYTISIGAFDEQTINAGTNNFISGVYFRYNHAVNGGNWTINNTAASVTTTANTSTAADTNWHTFTIVINATATSVAYYIDNVQVANSPITTNIPSATIGCGVYVFRNAGTVPDTDIDLFWIVKQLSNPRPGPLAGSIPANNRSIENYTQTAVSYQLLGTDAIVGVTSTAAPRTMTMPIVGIVAGQVWTIKDESGGAAANNITISGNGLNIDGSATKLITTNYGSMEIYYSGSAFFIR